MKRERWNSSDPGYVHLVKAEETAYTKDGVRKLIDIMARSGYSCRNSLLVYGQMADCKLESISDLKTEDAWDNVGRSVDLYSPGILVSVPDKSPYAPDGETTFKVHTVYDLAETKGKDYEPVPKSNFIQTRGFVYAAKYILASMGLTKERVVKMPIDLPIDYDISSGKLVFSETVQPNNTDALAWYAYARAKLLFSERKDADGMAKAVYQITARQIGAPIDERMSTFSIDGADYNCLNDLYQASTGMLHRIEKEFQKTHVVSLTHEGGQER